MSDNHMPTVQDYVDYYMSYEDADDYIIEICECEYDEHGNILDFATRSYQDDELASGPKNTPLQLNIMNNEFSKIEDVCISITDTGLIVNGNIHFQQDNN